VCCDGLVIFNFAVSFDFECYSQAQEISSVDCCLPYVRQQFIIRPLSALLPFAFVLKVGMEISSCLFPLLQCTSSTLLPLLCVSFQLLVYCSGFLFPFLLWDMGSVCLGHNTGLSQGWLEEYSVMFVAHLLVF
jgi:hypothetical protein